MNKMEYMAANGFTGLPVDLLYTTVNIIIYLE